MEKQITRTIKAYKHTFIKSHMEDGKLVIDDQQVTTTNEKLGTRKVAQFLKDNNLSGYVLAMVEPVNQTYSMSLNAFITAAKLIEEN